MYSSPGPWPDTLSVGAAAPTPTLWPTTDTGCIGVTSKATAIDANATSTPA
jgi:hypothetical protein